MPARFSLMLASATVLLLLAVGCQSKSGGAAGENKPLSAEEAAQYRQVKVKVAGAT